jgi:crossover junction endodeoxyribonuclease RusA
MMIALKLPFPPSNNHYYVRARGKTIISERGRAYTESVKQCKREQLSSESEALKCRLSIDLVVNAPDNRARDLDNMLKALLDSCTKAGIWLDDSQIDEINIVRGVSIKHGAVNLTIRELYANA